MFKSYVSSRFKSSKKSDEIFNLIEDELDHLGRTDVSSTGRIHIDGHRFSGFGYDTKITGMVRTSGDNHSVEIDISSRPSIIAWLITICFFPIGALILILPYNAKDEIQAKIGRALDDLPLRLGAGDVE